MKPGETNECNPATKQKIAIMESVWRIILLNFDIQGDRRDNLKVRIKILVKLS